MPKKKKASGKKGAAGGAVPFDPVSDVGNTAPEEDGERVKYIWEYDSDEEAAAGIALAESSPRATAAETAPEDVERLRKEEEERVQQTRRKKIEKRAKREAKTQEALEQQKEQIRRDAEKQPSKSEMERKRLEEMLSAVGKSIFSISPDGNCLYAAVAHQIFGDPQRFPEVRKLCAEAMRQEMDEYMPFVEGVSSAEDYLKYVTEVESSNEWGGHVELLALSKRLGFSAVVYQATLQSRPEDGADRPLEISAASTASSETKFIYLSYHRHFYALGEHYNSVVDSTVEPRLGLDTEKGGKDGNEEEEEEEDDDDDAEKEGDNEDRDAIFRRNMETTHHVATLSLHD